MTCSMQLLTHNKAIIFLVLVYNRLDVSTVNLRYTIVSSQIQIITFLNLERVTVIVDNDYCHSYFVIGMIITYFENK